MPFLSFVPSPDAKEPPDATFVTDRAVDNHVVTLRKKVEPEPSEPRYIVSVRGLGYRFDGGRAPSFARGATSAVLARGYKPRASGEPKARPLMAE